ncbi:MAG: formate--tetrahydrofolate ligase [Candidatus Omnitrophota bacterium]
MNIPGIARGPIKVPIEKIASRLGIRNKYLIPYGRYIAKIEPEMLRERRPRVKKSKYILVTAITPTPLGEGKTVTTIGLSMSLNRLGVKACACIRESSLGPLFGLKGGGAGGGRSQVVPAEEFNLHFTGDIHAVGFAHNLAAAYLDNSIYHGNRLNIAPEGIYWKRVIEVNDRSLRNIRLSSGVKGVDLRGSGFEITAASELMAILGLSENTRDLRARLGRVVLAERLDGGYVTAEDLKAAGSMAVSVRDALKPNLIQTIENTPCFVHTVPFANIAHGNSSILADRLALSCSEYVVTEAGFGADCGAEKFFNIKCRASGLKPDAAVLVCSVRALKAHSGRFRVVPGKPLDEGLSREDLDALDNGCSNLQKQIENILAFRVPVVVAVNRFAGDTDREISLVVEKALAFGAYACEVSELWARGSGGGIKLAESVIRAAETPNKFSFLYENAETLERKINAIACRIYGARDVEYSETARRRIELYTARGWGNLPVCMAKTQFSLSHDPRLKGRPEGFTLPVSDVRPAIGAGYLYALCGGIQTMPGLPMRPRGEEMDIDDNGVIRGL